MKEIFEIAMRSCHEDCKFVTQLKTAETDERSLIAAMGGRDIANIRNPVATTKRDVH
jgi:ABC-type sugar transport system ATPase subunit